MTICIAAVCRFGYKFDEQTKQFAELGAAILTASDRMMTAEKYGIEYEPHQMKRARLSASVELLIADDVVVHSEVLIRTHKEIGEGSNLKVKEAADIYSKHFREYKAEQAEHTYLSPFKLTTDSFNRIQKHMDEELVHNIANKILNYELNAEALIVGVEGNAAHIYHMDSFGILTCHDDIGFASIGSGTIHANSLFMANSYANIFPFYTALAIVYAAKRRAEIAPGVGKWTDMTLITKEGVFTTEQERIKILNEEYESYEKKRKKLEQTSLEKFQKRDVEIIKKLRSAIEQKQKGNKQ